MAPIVHLKIIHLPPRRQRKSWISISPSEFFFGSGIAFLRQVSTLEEGIALFPYTRQGEYMKKGEFRTPIIQSGAILFIFLLFFSFVTAAGADSFISGLSAIVSGIFHSILFTIGLIISIFLSIILLIAIFLATIALYSFDKAKDIWIQLQSTLISIFAAMNDYIALQKSKSCRMLQSHSDRTRQLEREVADLSRQNTELQQTISYLQRKLEEMGTSKGNSKTTRTEQFAK